MKTLVLGGTLTASRIAYGCMPVGGDWRRDSPVTAEARATAVACVRAALDAGITFFDHADIYASGKSETVFGEALRTLGVPRRSLILQSKVGIRFAGDPTPDAPGRYDFSAEHILASAEGSLARLGTDYLDLYLLHRPDALVEPDEVARAFDRLHQAGKVRHFGVSNHTRGQIELLQRSLRQPLLVNQVELSLLHSHLIHAGMSTNQAETSMGADLTLDFCRQQGITIQAWGPLASGRVVGRDGAGGTLPERLRAVARTLGVEPEAVAVAWLLRHPAGIQPIIGTTRPDRITASCKADGITLTREQWYALLEAGRGRPVA